MGLSNKEKVTRMLARAFGRGAGDVSLDNLGDMNRTFLIFRETPQIDPADRESVKDALAGFFGGAEVQCVFDRDGKTLTRVVISRDSNDLITALAEGG